ncbi:hypothetical protein HA050_00175 [Iodobacter sp. HSC-16F04]|uniref:Uncharacterized protein n=1 Tax=Iodobacter violaceini TaxID=3044271 RepID=A0ABX0KR51_9NEIS|nr:hypothetical protein [Iodobacter violacea]NHQ84537.1 hypothetical protein [Iodobacter violacea]
MALAIWREGRLACLAEGSMAGALHLPQSLRQKDRGASFGSLLSGHCHLCLLCLRVPLCLLTFVSCALSISCLKKIQATGTLFGAGAERYSVKTICLTIHINNSRAANGQMLSAAAGNIRDTQNGNQRF